MRPNSLKLAGHRNKLVFCCLFVFSFDNLFYAFCNCPQTSFFLESIYLNLYPILQASSEPISTNYLISIESVLLHIVI